MGTCNKGVGVRILTHHVSRITLHVFSSTSAICLTHGDRPRRCNPPLIWLIHPASQATTTFAELDRMLWILRSSMAREISGYSMENKPPKPQHSSPWRRSTISASFTFLSNKLGCCLTPKSRDKWQE